MERDTSSHVRKEPGEGMNESGAPDLRDTLGKVDKTLEAFYQIHGPLIKDQGLKP
jgi:hypothetical protein